MRLPAKRTRIKFLEVFAKTLDFEGSMNKIKLTKPQKAQIRHWFFSEDAQDDIGSALNENSLPYLNIHKGLYVKQLIDMLPSAQDESLRFRILKLLLQTSSEPIKDPEGAVNQFLDASFGDLEIED